MHQLNGPQCNSCVLERGLLKRPAHGLLTSFELAGTTYCPVCGAALQVSSKFGVWHFIACLGVFTAVFAAIWLWPRWAMYVASVLSPGLFIFIGAKARRLVAIPS